MYDIRSVVFSFASDLVFTLNTSVLINIYLHLQLFVISLVIRIYTMSHKISTLNMSKSSDLKGEHGPPGKQPNDLQHETILLYSSTEKGLDEYRIPFERCGLNFESTTDIKEVKRLLKERQFTAFLADVTDYDPSGRKMIAYAKSHAKYPLKTFGYTRTDLPMIMAKVYSCGADQRFYFEHKKSEEMTGVLFNIFINTPELMWIKNNMAAQKEVKAKIRRNPDALNVVLLKGNNGVGKLSLAQIIHGMSDRQPFEFILADCIPRSRFDYAKKTDEDTPKNRKELRRNFEKLLGDAYNGTLYIRSFTHLSIMAQEVLADVLANGMCRSDMFDRRVPYKGRIILSTSKNLGKLVENRQLSAELYTTITGTVMHIPTLTEFREEIVEMAESMVSNLCLKLKSHPMTFTREAKEAIRKYPWTGNLEEMYTVLSKAVQLARGHRIGSMDLKFELYGNSEEPEMSERQILLQLLEKHDGNKSAAMRDLGVSRATFYKRLRDNNISLNEY